MGTFSGHVIPGMFGCLMGLWWMFSISHRYATMTPFLSSSWFPWQRYPSKPIEPVFVVTVCGLATIMEYVGGFEDYGYEWTNMQHVVMYISMVMMGLTQLLQHYKKRVPPGFDYLCLMFSNIIICLQMYFHLHNRPPVDAMLHVLIICTTVALFTSVLLEFFNRGSPTLAMTRGMFIFLLGVNFLHTAFILYPPWKGNTMDLHSHVSMTKVNVLFGIELCSSAVLALAIFGLVNARCSEDTKHINGVRGPESWTNNKGVNNKSNIL